MLEQANEKYQVSLDIVDTFYRIKSTEVPVGFLVDCWRFVRSIVGYAIDQGPIRFFDADKGDPYEVQDMVSDGDPAECALYQLRLRDLVMRGAKADAMEAMAKDVRFMEANFSAKSIRRCEADCMPGALKATVSFYGCMGEFLYALSDEDKTDGVDMFLLELMRFQAYMMSYIEEGFAPDATYCDKEFADELYYLTNDYQHRLGAIEYFCDLPAFKEVFGEGKKLIGAMSAKFGKLDGWKQAAEENANAD